MSELTTLQREKLMDDVRIFISDAEEMMRLSAGEAGENATELRGRIEDRLQEARADLASLQSTVVSKVKGASRVTNEYVHENPWKSIGAAAGVGLLIGLLAGRR